MGYVERNSKEGRQWPRVRARHSKRVLLGAEGRALTPSITHLMRRYGAIVLLL